MSKQQLLWPPRHVVSLGVTLVTSANKLVYVHELLAMTSAASNYQESSHFIHQRYEDTAHVIFQQQEKVRQDEKRRQKHSNPFPTYKQASSPSKQLTEFNRYGNHGVVATETKKSPVLPEPVKPVKSSGTPNVQSTVNSSVCILT
ncbi:hypothetical protein ACF0H5_021203 [Mactra antiquata]